MNGIEKITAQIQTDMQREIDTLLAEAEEKAAALKADYEGQAQTVYNDAMNKGKQAAAERLDRQSRVAELEARKMVLEAKQEKIDQAFRLAHEKLMSMNDGERVALNARLVAASAQTGRETIIMNKQDHDAIGTQVVEAANHLFKGGAFVLGSETRKIEGGLILSAGDVEVNCAYDTILRILRDDLAGDVAQVLFS